MRTLEQWTDLVKVSVRDVTNEEAAAIGLQCFEVTKVGKTTSVWHESSRYFGGTCVCVPCMRKRARTAQSTSAA